MKANILLKGSRFVLGLFLGGVVMAAPASAIITGGVGGNISQLMDDDYDNTGYGLDAYIGLDILPRIDLLAFASLHFGRENFGIAGDTNLYQIFAGPVAQFWVTEQIGVRAGGGYAYTYAKHTVDVLGTTYDFDYDRNGFAAYSGLVFKVIPTGLLDIDLHISYIPQWYDSDNKDDFVHWISGGVGVSF